MDKGQGFADFFAFGRLDENDFLSKVDRLVDWQPISARLSKIYKVGYMIDGRPAWNALVMFKIILLEKWYNLSDPAVEESLHYDIRFVRFSGLSLDDQVPDHSTISRFRKRLRERGLDEILLKMINEQLEQKSLIVRNGVIADATLIPSARRPRKVLQMEKQVDADSEMDTSQLSDNTDDVQYEASADGVVYSDDPDADWKVLGKRVVYGYAGHMVADAENGLVLAVEVTPASCSETKMLANLIDKCEVKVGTRVYADKGYSGNPNREALRKRKLKNGIMHRAARGKKLSDRDKMFNQIVSVTRYKIERTFGTIKKHLGQGRARYVGLGNTAFDLRMASIAYNLKRAVNMLPVELAA